MSQVLQGVRVLEVALYAFVPAAGAVLSDWGADVIKVEHSETGDPMRSMASWGMPASVDGLSCMWEVSNRGKRAIAVDMANPEGRELILSLAERADVFLTSFLPGARKRLGIDVSDVMARNPKIIYARGSGHGPAGPEADRGGFDAISYWARPGVSVSMVGSNDEWPPPLPGPGFGDVQSGMALAGGVAAALYHREKTNEGSVVDSSLLAAGMWAMQAVITGSRLIGKDRLVTPDRTRPGNPIVNTYRTSDGRFICLAMLVSDRFWAGFCKAIDRVDMIDDPRYSTAGARSANTEECTAELSAVFSGKTLAECKEMLARQDGHWDVVQLPSEAAADPQVIQNGYVCDVAYGPERTLVMVPAPVQFDELTVKLGRAPEHGEHTDEVVAELGLSPEEIIGLKISGAIK